MRTRLWRCIATVVALVPGASIGALADETDNFTCRSRLTRDSGGALNAWMNGKIRQAIARANRRGSDACNSDCLLHELQKAIGGSSPERLTLIPHAQFEQWIRKQPGLDRCHLKFSDTIYGAHAYNQPWMLPFNGRIIFVADSIRLFGHVVGIDKISHFIREGFDDWRDVRRNGRDIASVMKGELGPPGWQLRWNEHGLKGLSLTGVIAYADLAAGYSGFRFWTDLLSIGRSDSFVTYNASSRIYIQTRPFTFTAYVNDAWDEAVNYSAFDPALGRVVAAALGQRSLTRPIADCRFLSSLPDARLYVNPACL
jgi:hypothetical protein